MEYKTPVAESAKNPEPAKTTVGTGSMDITVINDALNGKTTDRATLMKALLSVLTMCVNKRAYKDQVGQSLLLNGHTVESMPVEQIQAAFAEAKEDLAHANYPRLHMACLNLLSKLN